MTAPRNNQSNTSGEEEDMLEKINNKLDRIQSDTHNLNRIASLRDKQLIITELKKAIGKSDERAAVLYLTKEPISSGDLANALGVTSKNLSKYINPFLDNKSFLTQTSEGRRVFYQRSELVDLVGLDKDQEFMGWIDSWRATLESKNKGKGNDQDKGGEGSDKT